MIDANRTKVDIMPRNLIQAGLVITMVAITTGRSHLNSAIFDDLGGCIYSTCVARHRLLAHCNKPVMWVIRPLPWGRHR